MGGGEGGEGPYTRKFTVFATDSGFKISGHAKNPRRDLSQIIASAFQRIGFVTSSSLVYMQSLLGIHESLTVPLAVGVMSFCTLS